MAIYKFKGYIPIVHKSAFIHPTASVIGNVTIGKDVYIGPGASVRGDFGEIIIEDGCNVQDNCIIHMLPAVTVLLGENVHLGHAVTIHGATIEANVLVGMNSVVMDNVKIGEGSIVAAMSMVPTDMEIPPRKLVAGIPARIRKGVTNKMLEWKTEGTSIYQRLPKDCTDTLAECEPLRRPPVFKPPMEGEYKTWKEIKESH